MASHFEQTQKKLETLLQSSEKGKALFEDLRKFSFDTTFGVDELADAGSELINAGVAVSDLQKRLKMLGDIAGGNKAKFAELSSIYSKIILQGKAGSQVLSQFNIRGVPLNKTLQEMGVVGSASAEQVTKALEKLTAEGGQFHDAMNNIIDTIEGKRGFIDDTQKEILVNFGEMTGMTDAYKLALDVLYEVLDKINNALMWINEHPIVKGLLAGVFATAVVGLVQIILTNLIPALTALIVKLTAVASLKAIINPASLIAGGVVAGIVAITAALGDSDSKAKKLKDSFNGIENKTSSVLDNQISLNELLDIEIQKRILLGQITENPTKDETEYERKIEELKKAKSFVEQFESSNDFVVADWNMSNGNQANLDETYAKIEKIQKVMNTLKDRGAKLYSPWEYTEDNNFRKVKLLSGGYEKTPLSKDDILYKRAYDELNVLNELIPSLQVQVELENKLSEYNQNKNKIDILEREIELINDENEATKKLLSISPNKTDYDKLLEINKAKDVLTESKKIKGFTEVYENGVLKLKEDLLINIDPSYKAKIDQVKKYIDGQEFNLKIKLKKERMEDYQKALAEVFNFSDKEILAGFADKGATAVDKFIKNTNKKFERLEGIADVLGLDKLDIAKDKIDYIKDAIQEILESKDENGNYIWGLDENTINLLKEYLKLTETQSAGSTSSKTSASFGNTDLVGQLTSSLEEAFKKAFENNKGFGEGFKNGIQDFVKNIDWASFGIGMLIQAISKLAEAIQNRMAEFDDTGIVLNPFDAVAKKLDGLIQSFVEFQEVVNNFSMEGLGGLLELIGSIFRVIGKFGELFFKASRMFSIPILLIVKLLSKLASVIGWFADWLDNLFDNWFGWVDDLLGSGEELVDAQEEEAERLRRLNDQYSALYDAIKEQEAYYLQKKMEINAGTYKENVTKVNDMILTPKGTFSTSPQDTILAMKHPENLMNSRSGISVTINDYAGNNIETSTDDYGNLIVNISRRIAEDYASGSNGWENAYNRRTVALQGKAYSI